MELFKKGRELERKCIKDIWTTPVNTGFAPAYLADLIQECGAEGCRSVKGLLTQDQLIPGPGNSIAQDIMFKTGLYPKRSIAGFSKAEFKKLHQPIVKTMAEAIRLGGRNGETDLYGNSGGCKRIMDKAAMGDPVRSAGRKSRRWPTREAHAMIVPVVSGWSRVIAWLPSWIFPQFMWFIFLLDL